MKKNLISLVLLVLFFHSGESLAVQALSVPTNRSQAAFDQLIVVGASSSVEDQLQFKSAGIHSDGEQMVFASLQGESALVLTPDTRAILTLLFQNSNFPEGASRIEVKRYGQSLPVIASDCNPVVRTCYAQILFYETDLEGEFLDGAGTGPIRIVFKSENNRVIHRHQIQLSGN